jgi:hypothetical protein
MAYDVNRTDGTRVVIVPDRTLQPVAGISLLGKNYNSYGEIIAENMVRMLEHFSNSEAPELPLPGQIWYKKDTKTLYVYVDDVFMWQPFGGVPEVTGLDNSKIKDTNGIFHEATKIKVGGSIIAIVVNDSFSPHQDTMLTAQFPNLNPGINFSTSTGPDGDVIYKLRGRSIEAEFADMAEIYTADMELQAGHIIKLGGHAEITKTTEAFDRDVFGVISTAPGFLLNSKDKLKTHAYPVALKGRVPCFVTGEVRKGQRIVASDIHGVGMATNDYDPTAIIGRAITAKESNDIGVIEVAIGAK